MKALGFNKLKVHSLSKLWFQIVNLLPYSTVTGYPIPAGERIMNNGRPARKEDWNKYVLKTGLCPWTGQAAQPKY